MNISLYTRAYGLPIKLLLQMFLNQHTNPAKQPHTFSTKNCILFQRGEEGMERRELGTP
jgi:hypothetical protein